ncbi:MAG: hypothetical protein JNM07_03435 [Phycisphaerae bacterium]|nr:hypothetical protein [Phycisphaerae bacterium]
MSYATGMSVFRVASIAGIFTSSMLPSPVPAAVFPTAARADHPWAAPPLDAKSVREGTYASIDRLVAAASEGELSACMGRLQAEFDELAAVPDDAARADLIRLAVTIRLGLVLKALPTSARAEAAALLSGRPRLGRELALLMRPQADQPSACFQVLRALAASDPRGRESKDGGLLERFAPLAAAIAVVHDRPVHIRAERAASTRGPNRAVAREAVDPAALFTWLTGADGALAFGADGLPSDLYVYVVDAPLTDQERAWALARYKGDRQVGRHFFDVVYDTEAFFSGKDKRIEDQSYTLQNLLKFGGVCVDQAYFASNVGKSIGVPSVILSAQGAGPGHAWVGFLELRGNFPSWNFESGRYTEYKNLTGTATDPQSGERLTDGELVLLTEFARRPEVDRWTAIALTDAATRLADADRASGRASGPAGLAPGTPGEPETGRRAARVEAAQSWLRRAVDAAPTYARAWREAARLSAEFSLARRAEWQEAAVALAGVTAPAFVVEILDPMIAAAATPAERAAQWEFVARKLSERGGIDGTKRYDLAARVRIAQGDMYARAGDEDNALRAYDFVLAKLVNDTAEARVALERAESLFQARKVAPDVVASHMKAWWQKARRPSESAARFMSSSNWFILGQRAASWLVRAGKSREADAILAQLPKPPR